MIFADNLSLSVITSFENDIVMATQSKFFGPVVASADWLRLKKEVGH